MKCDGNSEDHCCYLSKGQPCIFIKEYKEGPRRWSCGLFEKYGSWKNVHASNEYISEVKPEWEAMIKKTKELYPDRPDEQIATCCGDWPTPGEKCGTCGLIG